MLRFPLKSEWGRLAGGIAGSLLHALAVNCFVVPLGLYTGGLLGAAQLLRTLAQEVLGLQGFDFSGLLYLLMNIPIFLLAYRSLGPLFFRKALICTVANTVFLSALPVLPTPPVADTLTACLMGGGLSGLGAGVMLTCGCSSGGLEILGLHLARRGNGLSLGQFNLLFNTLLYLLCGLLLSVDVMIYSILCTLFTTLVLDRAYQQSITVQALIFTKLPAEAITRRILAALHRGLTCWEGWGAYTGQRVHVLCVCLTKAEIADLRSALAALDPDAFLILQEGVRVGGSFARRFT